MIEQIIKTILENGLYQNGEQPDIVLERGIIVDDIECENADSIEFIPDATSKISGNCIIYGSDTEDEPVKIKVRFTIEISNTNDIEIFYEDFI